MSVIEVSPQCSGFWLQIDPNHPKFDDDVAQVDANAKRAALIRRLRLIVCIHPLCTSIAWRKP